MYRHAWSELLGHSALDKLFWMRYQLILPTTVLLNCKCTIDDCNVCSRKSKISLLKILSLLLQSWDERSTCTILRESIVRIAFSQWLPLYKPGLNTGAGGFNERTSYSWEELISVSFHTCAAREKIYICKVKCHLSKILQKENSTTIYQGLALQ